MYVTQVKVHMPCYTVVLKSLLEQHLKTKHGTFVVMVKAVMVL